MHYNAKLEPMKNPSNSVNTPFSTAELKVAELLAKGYSEKEIADRLNVSPNTVNNHTRNIREKNGLSKNIEIVLLYISYVNKKKFSLKNIREFGLSTILVLLNVCDISTIS